MSPIELTLLFVYIALMSDLMMYFTGGYNTHSHIIAKLQDTLTDER